jgi:hypothetical protein
MSICDTGKRLVDLTDDGEAGPSDTVKDELVDKPDERGKQDVIIDHVQLPPVLRPVWPPQVLLGFRFKFYRISLESM